MLISDTVLELEALQRWAYDKIGVDASKIAESIEKYKYHRSQHLSDKNITDIPAVNELLDPVIRAEIDAAYASLPRTRFQDPIILKQFYKVFEDVLDTIQKTNGDCPINPETTILGTIPLSMLNGFTFKSASGDNVIVLQEGLRSTPDVVADFIVSCLITTFENEITIEDDAATLSARLQPQESPISQFMGSMYYDLTNEGLVAISLDRLEWYMRDSIRHACLKAVSNGYIAMLVAHEVGHCFHDHISRLDLDKDQEEYGRMTEALSIMLKQRYPDVVQPKKTQLHERLMRQGFEQEADFFAYSTISNWLAFQASNEETPWVRLHFLGMVGFFWYAELVERSMRVARGGPLVVAEPSLLDRRLEDLLTRHSHPSPRSRVASIVENERLQYRQQGHQEGPFERANRSLEMIFEHAWFRDADLYRHLYEHNKFQVSAKWMEIPPIGMRGIGFDYL